MWILFPVCPLVWCNSLHIYSACLVCPPLSVVNKIILSACWIMLQLILVEFDVMFLYPRNVALPLYIWHILNLVAQKPLNVVVRHLSTVVLFHQHHTPSYTVHSATRNYTNNTTAHINFFQQIVIAITLQNQITLLTNIHVVSIRFKVRVTAEIQVSDVVTARADHLE